VLFRGLAALLLVLLPEFDCKTAGFVSGPGSADFTGERIAPVADVPDERPPLRDGETAVGFSLRGTGIFTGDRTSTKQVMISYLNSHLTKDKAITAMKIVN